MQKNNLVYFRFCKNIVLLKKPNSLIVSFMHRSQLKVIQLPLSLLTIVEVSNNNNHNIMSMPDWLLSINPFLLYHVDLFPC